MPQLQRLFSRQEGGGDEAWPLCAYVCVMNGLALLSEVASDRSLVMPMSYPPAVQPCAGVSPRAVGSLPGVAGCVFAPRRGNVQVVMALPVAPAMPLYHCSHLSAVTRFAATQHPSLNPQWQSAGLSEASVPPRRFAFTALRPNVAVASAAPARQAEVPTKKRDFEAALGGLEILELVSGAVAKHGERCHKTHGCLRMRRHPGMCRTAEWMRSVPGRC